MTFYSRLSFILVLLIFVLFGTTSITESADLITDGKYIQEFNFTKFRDGLTPDILVLKSILEFDISLLTNLIIADLNLQGFVTSENKASLEVNEAVLSSIIMSGFIEVGKKNWIWGQGFSFSPTYPLERKEDYWGSELNINQFSVGGVLDQNHEEMYSGWARYQILMEKSDVTFVTSYLNDTIKNGEETGKIIKYNIGADYSRQLFEGMSFYSGANLTYRPDLDDEFGYQYLLGGTYLINDDLTLSMEHYQQKDKYIMFSLDYTSFTKPLNWGIREIYNLDDYGQIQILKMEYDNQNNLVPSIEIINFAGPDNSIEGKNPTDFQIKLNFEVKF